MPRSSPPPGRTPRLGQHFLADRRAIGTIVSAIGATRQDHLLEIGPGGGALTEPLAAAAGRLTAIEIDPVWAARLGERFAGQPHVTILAGDILESDLAALASPAGVREPGGRFLVAGNLPYSVATPIVRKLLDASDAAGEPIVQEAVIMLQREVAHRLLAAPGGKDYGFLSVHMSLRAEAEPILDLPPGAFRPAPKVHSTVIRLRPRGARETGLSDRDIRALDRLLSAAFSQRRKQLGNALAGLVPGDDPGALDRALEAAGVRREARAEQIGPDGLLALARALAPAFEGEAAGR